MQKNFQIQSLIKQLFAKCILLSVVAPALNWEEQGENLKMGKSKSCDFHAEKCWIGGANGRRRFYICIFKFKKCHTKLFVGWFGPQAVIWKKDPLWYSNIPTYIIHSNKWQNILEIASSLQFPIPCNSTTECIRLNIIIYNYDTLFRIGTTEFIKLPRLTTWVLSPTGRETYNRAMSRSSFYFLAFVSPWSSYDSNILQL